MLSVPDRKRAGDTILALVLFKTSPYQEANVDRVSITFVSEFLSAKKHVTSSTNCINFISSSRKCRPLMSTLFLIMIARISATRRKI